MNILDRAKDVAQAVHEIKSLELSRRIANLHSDIVALVEENVRLNDENKELKETLRLKREMKYKEPFYFVDGDEMPFCPVGSPNRNPPVSCVWERAR
jgi:regulator of replication initiation timing